MPKKRIESKQAPKPGGPYSPAIEVDGWVFVAGQVPIDPATGQFVTGDIQAQTDRVLRNVQAILEAAGASLKDVVKTTVFMTDLTEFGAMNEVYGRFFSDASPPARATLEAKNLPRGCKVEIEAVARIGAGQ
ncbi:MAG: deaminase [Planctomycetes bacterium]|nr:deaminase [Planctomycetota bacterium]